MKFFGKVILQGSSVTTMVTQADHGLAVGDVVRLSGSNYVKAKADSVTHAEAVGIVDSVSGSSFHVAFPGSQVSGLSGLTAGTVYFLSVTTAGLLTANDAPDGYISKPMLVATSDTTGVVLNSRGVYKVVSSNPTNEVINEPPVGDTNGINTVFTLEFAPVANSLRLYLNGVRREEDTDFTLSSVTITFLTPPVSGSVLLADYTKT